MMLPEKCLHQLTDNQVVLQFQLPSDLFWFQGHFPEQAILPGVTQIHFVMHYAKTLLNIDLPFKGMDVIKFQRPIFPNETVELTIQWSPDNHKLNFQYQCNGITASSGRIALSG